MPILNLRVESKNEKGEIHPAPEELTSTGPIIPVTLTLSDETQRVYTDKGEQPPESVSGYAMIDTGATTTCFDQTCAKKAGLPIVGTSKMASATQREIEVPVFAGKIALTPSNIVINVEKGLGANLSAFNGLVALIGRDLLGSSIFIYNGPAGSISISI